MKPDHTIPNISALRQLNNGDTALYGKDQPLIVARYGRFHMVSNGYVVNLKGRITKGIVAVNFLSAARAENTISSWLPTSELKPLDKLTRTQNAELDAKLLPTAQDYLPLLRMEYVQVVAGSTTDTLQSMPYDRHAEEHLVAAIARMMKTGAMGPFLSFKHSYQVVRRAMQAGSQERPAEV